MPQPTIDADKCVVCGACAAVCPSMIFERTKDGMRLHPDRADWCFACGQCMAVCPSEAVLAPQHEYAEFGLLPETQPTAEELEGLLLTRRSVRRFTEKPVAREALEEVVRLAATAPTGVPPSDVEVTVFSTREQIAAILPDIYAGLEQFLQALRNPLWRFLIRRSMDPPQFEAIVEHMVPFIEPMCGLYRDTGFDAATWGAPAMLLFHHARRSVCGKENSYIACTYAMLAAHALGLGTTMIGIVPPIVEQSKPLRARLGIPEGNRCEISLIIGHPAVHYRRTISRAHKSVTWLK